jgi:hypothetical protein
MRPGVVILLIGLAILVVIVPGMLTRLSQLDGKDHPER